MGDKFDGKVSPEKELPEPVPQVHPTFASLYCPPNYQQPTGSQQTMQQQLQQPLQFAQPLPIPINFPTQTQPLTSSLSAVDTWVPSLNAVGNLPSPIVHVGYDIDKSFIYVGRAFHHGDYITAKAFPSHNLACFPYQGTEICTSTFEYLVGDKYIWLPSNPFPRGAVIVNPMSPNERCYIGRAIYNDSKLCGKFVCSLNLLYVPFNKREVPIDGPCEILVHVDRHLSGMQT